VTPDQMLQVLTGVGTSAMPMAPMMRPTVPGVMPPAGQGSGKPALNAQQILQLMAQPKLQGKVR